MDVTSAWDGIALQNAIARDGLTVEVAEALALSWRLIRAEERLALRPRTPPEVEDWHTLHSRLVWRAPWSRWPTCWFPDEAIEAYYFQELEVGPVFAIGERGSDVVASTSATAFETVRVARSVGEFAIQLVVYGLVVDAPPQPVREELAGLDVHPWPPLLGLPEGVDGWIGGRGVLGIRNGLQVRTVGVALPE